MHANDEQQIQKSGFFQWGWRGKKITGRWGEMAQGSSIWCLFSNLGAVLIYICFSMVEMIYYKKQQPGIICHRILL